MWGFANQGGQFQYPGPTIRVKAGDVVTVNLVNNGIPEPVSMVFFGQDTHQAPVYETVGDNRTLRSMGAEAISRSFAVSYTFTATNPGTYYYQSGTNVHKQIDMGLTGLLIVDPDPLGDFPLSAYGTADSQYDNEFFLLMSAIDPVQHQRVELGLPYQATEYLPAYWFLNGRAYPDTLKNNNAFDLPAQPMSALVMIRAAQKNLFRVVTFDRDMHPLHQHGENATIIAHNGRLRQSSPAAGVADLANSVNTESTHSGETFDGIYIWVNKDMGWDVYGHPPGARDPNEDSADHNKPLPVNIPPDANLIWGDMYGGSPYLGMTGPLPVSHVQANMEGANIMMFHSHHEVEIQNFDLGGPGGMMTHIMIMP